jgi:hypothetical protein
MRSQKFSARVLRDIAGATWLASVLATAFIGAGLIGFLTDEVRSSSDAGAARITFQLGDGTTVTRTVPISLPNPRPEVERLREAKHTGAREVIDDVGDVLMSPFSWIAIGSDPWVRRLLYSGMALLIYGLLGSMLAGKLRRWADGARRGAIAHAEEDAAAKRKESGTYLSPA